MDKKIIVGVIIFASIALVIGLMIPGGQTPPVQTYPWQIERTEFGSIRVFSLTLGESTLIEAEQAFHSTSEVSLFVPGANEHQRVIEAYFDKVILGGLSAKVIAVMQVEPEQLQQFYARGTRISSLADGSHKVSLHAQDIERLKDMPVATLTYLPRVSLDKVQIGNRFGKPEKIFVEEANNTTHWLYPNYGLDVALDAHGNAVLQYVIPSHFSQLTGPLSLKSNNAL